MYWTPIQSHADHAITRPYRYIKRPKTARADRAPQTPPISTGEQPDRIRHLAPFMPMIFQSQTDRHTSRPATTTSRSQLHHGYNMFHRDTSLKPTSGQLATPPHQP